MSKVNSGHNAVQTGRQANACPLGGRKAVYRADTRMLCKEYVKQTALTQVDHEAAQNVDAQNLT